MFVAAEQPEYLSIPPHMYVKGKNPYLYVCMYAPNL